MKPFRNYPKKTPTIPAFSLTIPSHKNVSYCLKPINNNFGMVGIVGIVIKRTDTRTHARAHAHGKITKKLSQPSQPSQPLAIRGLRTGIVMGQLGNLGQFRDSSLKALRDQAHQQMLLARQLDNPDTYAAAKAIYSALCADYFDLMQGDNQ